MNIIHHILLVIALFLIFPLTLNAQDYKEEISKNQSRINSIRDEISQYETRLKSEQSKEKSEIEKLNETNQKISLMHQLIGSLEKNSRFSEMTIGMLSRQMEKTQQEQNYYKKIIAQRLVQIYKHRDDNPLAFILTSQSFTQAYSRNKYLKMIAEQDKKDVMTLRNKYILLQNQKTEKQELLRTQQAMIFEKQTETRVIQKEIKNRTSALQRIRKSKNALSALIEERREDIQTLNILISELEKKRKEAENRVESKTDIKSGKTKTVQPNVKLPGLTASKGRIPYPATGRIAIKYGNQVHPILGTKTFYPGVGILTAEKAPVYAVSRGVVSLITYLRRFGNTVIIDHGGSFYTVYAQLGEVYVSNGESVQGGDLIGRVDHADDGRPILHFEIYKDKEAVDPTAWLK